jgi:hypothetical protein
MSAFGGKADITATERNFNLRLPQKLRQRCSPRSAAASSFVSSLAAVIAPAHPRNKYMQGVAHKEENHELVSPDSIYSRHSNSQLLDARFSGCRCYLDYLLIRRTLKRVLLFNGPRWREAAFGHHVWQTKTCRSGWHTATGLECSKNEGHLPKYLGLNRSDNQSIERVILWTVALIYRNKWGLLGDSLHMADREQ